MRQGTCVRLSIAREYETQSILSVRVPYEHISIGSQILMPLAIIVDILIELAKMISTRMGCMKRCYLIATSNSSRDHACPTTTPSYNSHTLPIRKGIAAFIKFKSGSNDRPNPSSTSMLTTTLDMAGSIST